MAASKWQVYNEAKKYLLTGDIDLNTATTTFSLGMAISTGFMTGPLACSSTVGARPSQNCATCPAAL